MEYLGSKNRIAKELVPIIQNYIDENEIVNYYEPLINLGVFFIAKKYLNCLNYVVKCVDDVFFV